MGSSSSQTASTTQSADNRQVVDGGSIGVSNSTGNTVNITDAGIIDAGLKFLGAADSANSDRLRMMLEAGGAVIASNSAVTAQVLEAKKAVDTPASSDAASESQKTMIYAAMVAAGFFLIKAKL